MSHFECCILFYLTGSAQGLFAKAQELFGLESTILLYDLTNMYGESYEYLMCYALYSKAYVNWVTRTRAFYIVIGIDGEGRQRLLALEFGDEESTANWSKVFRSLK